MFVQIVDSHIPMTKARVRAKTLPWIDSDVRRLMKARTYYRTKAKKSMRVEDWEQYRKLTNQVTWRLKKAKLEYFGSLSQQSSRNPRKVWKELLGRGSRQKIEAIRTQNGRITDQQGIVEELSRYFSSWSGVPGVDVDVERLSHSLTVSSSLKRRMF